MISFNKVKVNTLYYRADKPRNIEQWFFILDRSEEKITYLFLAIEYNSVVMSEIATDTNHSFDLTHLAESSIFMGDKKRVIPFVFEKDIAK